MWMRDLLNLVACQIARLAQLQIASPNRKVVFLTEVYASEGQRDCSTLNLRHLDIL